MKDAYSWEAVYQTAVLELDSFKMPVRIHEALHIHEALQAIEEKFQNTARIDDREYRAIENARQGLPH
jgi:hypothetical protein